MVLGLKTALIYLYGVKHSDPSGQLKPDYSVFVPEVCLVLPVGLPIDGCQTSYLSTHHLRLSETVWRHKATCWWLIPA